MGVWGLVLAGGVCALVLVSVLVCFCSGPVFLACGLKGCAEDRVSVVWRSWVLSCVCGAGFLVGAVLGGGGWYYGGCVSVGVFACGCRERGGGNLLVLVPSPSLFLLCGADGGV